MTSPGRRYRTKSCSSFASGTSASPSRGTWLEDCLGRLHDELGQRGLRVRPHAWIGEEWFTPDDTPGIAIPFYLAHPRLMRLERKQILDVEGGSVAECQRILRHEAGHVVQAAYRLQRRRRWQKLFGRSSIRYPRYYRPDPTSRNYVQHLRLWYAQAHPDEDFAETFAVWLRPRSDWRKRYAGWPALAKLEYVDELMTEIAGERPMLHSRRMVDPISRIDRTLAEHYETQAGGNTRSRRRPSTTATCAASSPTIRGTAPRRRPRRSCAATAPRSARRSSRWTQQHQLTLDSILDEMIVRCRELKLRAPGPERKLRVDFTILFTATAVYTLYGSRAAPLVRPLRTTAHTGALAPGTAAPESLKGLSEQEIHNIRTEFEIVNTLRESGHEVRPLGVQHELKPIRRRDPGVAAAHRLQPAGGVPRRDRLRPERGELPRAVAAFPTPAATRAA